MKRIVDIAGRIQLAVFGLAALLPLAANASPSFIGIGDASVQQPAAGTAPLTFTLTRSGSNGDTLDTGYAVVVPYATVDDSAIAGTDYGAASGSVTIPAGATSATVSVPVLAGSNTVDKSFFLNLASATGIGPVPSFGPAANPGVGANPFALAVGDFNGDGKPDLATANANSNTVSILLNSTAPGAASASYTLVASLSVGTVPAAIAVGDFNGDGKPDLAVANQGDNTVSILLNGTAPGAASASFTLAASPAVGAAPAGIVVADLNGDGKPDVAVTNLNDNSVSLFYNITPASADTSSATFIVFNLPGFGAAPVGIAAGDFDADGLQDLVVANSNGNSVTILRNRGAAPASFSVGANPIAVAVGDFNGDGKPDVAVANQGSNTVSILLNSTAPGAATSFTLAASPSVGSAPAGIVAGDFNGDGKPDLAVANLNSSNVSILFNATPASNSTASASFTLAVSPAVGSGPAAIAVDDFNGDGKPDLATANVFANSVSVLLNGTPASAAALNFAAPAAFGTNTLPRSVARGDFNGDGRPDLAVANLGSSAVSVLLNASAPGATSASFAAAANFGTGANPISVAVGDFNGDGKPDLAVANIGSASISVLLDTSAAGAAVASFAPAADFGAGDIPSFVAVGDFNGDGRPDLAVTRQNSNIVSVLLNSSAQGNAVPSFAAAADFGVGTRPSSVAIGDFNGDGLSDLAVTNQDSNDVSVLLNLTAPGAGAPSFAPAASFGTGNVPLSVAVGDFNGDGRPDLAVVNNSSSSKSVSILLNSTTPGAAVPSFAAATAFGVGTAPYSVSVSDFDGDGRPDLAVVNVGTSNVSVLLNRTVPGAAVPSFAAAANIGAGTNPIAVTVGDLNGDGLPDLTVANYFDNTVSVLLNTRLQASLSDTFAVGTITSNAADTTPDAFTFIDVTVPAGTSTRSNTITVSGINAAVPLVLSGPSTAAPQYAINGGKFKYYNTTGGGPKVSNGDRVQLRAISSQSAGTVDLVLSLGSVSDTWTLTTATGSNTPNAFDFKDKLNQPANRYIGSGGVRISGINTPVAISISGDASASFRINNGAYIAGPAMVSNGDLVVLRLKSSATPGAEVSATVSIGGVTDQWTVTTAGAP